VVSIKSKRRPIGQKKYFPGNLLFGEGLGPASPTHTCLGFDKGIQFEKNVIMRVSRRLDWKRRIRS